MIRGIHRFGQNSSSKYVFCRALDLSRKILREKLILQHLFTPRIVWTKGQFLSKQWENRISVPMLYTVFAYIMYGRPREATGGQGRPREATGGHAASDTFGSLQVF